MIDASIPLQVHGVTVENPLNSYARAMELRNLDQQHQLGEEHLTGARLANQQAQRQVDLAQRVADFYQHLYAQPEDAPATPGTAAATPATAPASPIAPATQTPQPAGSPIRSTIEQRQVGGDTDLSQLTPEEQSQAVWNLPHTETALVPSVNQPAIQAPAFGMTSLAPRAAAPAQPAQAAAQPGTMSQSANFHRALASLAGSGGGAAIPGLLATHTEQLTKSAILQKDQFENMQRQAEQISAMLQPIQNAPPEQREALYQRTLPWLQATAKTFGVDAQHIPANYDPNFVTSASAFGIKAADQARIAKEGADTLRLASEANIKNADAFQKEYRNDLATVRDAADLDVKNHKFEALAHALDPSGNLSRTFANIRESEYTPDLAKRMNSATMTGEQRAMLPIHEQTAQLAQDRLGETRRSNDIRQQNADTNAHRLKNETAAAHRSDISRLADQAIAESNSNGGSGIPDAIKNVENTSYYQNHPIGQSRGEVLAELQHRKIMGPGGLDEQHRQGAADKSQPLFVPGPDGKLTIRRPGQPTSAPAAPARPAATPTTPTATASPNTVHPNSTGTIKIQRGDGVVREFPDEGAAKRFEDLVKSAGGTTTRVTQ